MPSGQLRGVRAIRGSSWGYDETIDGSFGESDKFITLRTFQGRAGFWATNSFLSSALGSDFKYLEWGMVVDEFCKTADLGLLNWINRNLAAKTDGTGYLTDESATRVEQDILPQLHAQLGNGSDNAGPINIEGQRGHVSGLGFAISRTTDYLTTQRLAATGSLVPLIPNQGTDISIGLARSAEAA